MHLEIGRVDVVRHFDTHVDIQHPVLLVHHDSVMTHHQLTRRLHQV
jgi:hypothetical protein